MLLPFTFTRPVLSFTECEQDTVFPAPLGERNRKYQETVMWTL